jgi:Peptidase A4 family
MRFAISLAAAAALAAVAIASADADSTSSNWAGYAVADPSTVATGATTAPFQFTSVTATWKQPKASCTSGSATYSAFWVGLGGFSEASNALEQIGTASDCTASGVARYYAWFELVPAASTQVALKINAGDTVTASVNVSGANVLVQVKDRTRKTSYTKLLPMASPDLASAEWIAEAPSACTTGGQCHVLPLSDFGSVTFTKIAAIANTHPGTITDPFWTSALIRLVPDPNGVSTSTLGATPAVVTADGRTFGITAAAY